MKTTVEIPDAILRSAKARAAERDIPLRQFVTDALTEKLKPRLHPPADDLMRLVGGSGT